MSNNQGTPKTLAQAIDNGIADAATGQYPNKTDIEVIEFHVLDFLAQRFNSFILKNPEVDAKLLALFGEIKPKKQAVCDHVYDANKTDRCLKCGKHGVADILENAISSKE